MSHTWHCRLDFSCAVQTPMAQPVTRLHAAATKDAPVKEPIRLPTNDKNPNVRNHLAYAHAIRIE